MLFRKLGLWTVVAVYFLIFVGGVVRATGSGMGCPDWPKCFGRWVPPSSAEQLPPNYKEVFGAKLKGEVEFNPLKTWTEYVNRLVGVTIGLLIFATLLASIPYLKTDKVIFYCSLLSFFLVMYEGWLGSKVVSTELKPLMVTLHMMLSILLILVLLYAVARSYNGVLKVENVSNSNSINTILVAVILISAIQIVLGTQVRQGIDVVARVLGEAGRDSWIGNLGTEFKIHRSFSWVVLGLNSWLFYLLFKNTTKKGILVNFAKGLMTCILLEILLGIVLAYWSVPPFAQPLHMTIATISVGIQFVMLLLLNKQRVFRGAMIGNFEIVK